MKQINPSELNGKGYTEVADWKKDFGMTYSWPNMILAIAFFVGLFLAFRGRVTLGGIVMLVSFIVLVVLWCFFRHSKPISPITGKRLTQYLSTNPTPRDPYDPNRKPIVEMVYVDHESKKYFTHVFIENDSTGE